MKDLKLTIELLPKGAWNNDFSKTLPIVSNDTNRIEWYLDKKLKPNIILLANLKPN